MRRETTLEIAGQLMHNYEKAGEYGAEIFLPWDFESEPPESDTECLLRLGGNDHALPLGKLAEIFNFANQGIRAKEQSGVRRKFSLRGDLQLSRQEECNLICELRDLGLLRPIEEGPGSAG